MILVPKPNKNTKRIENYRPLSLLEVTGKLLEKIVNIRVVDIMEENDIFNERHHGFRKCRSTQTAIAITTELLAIAKAQNNQVNLILRDVSKAFDKVWHHGLMYKILQTTLPLPYKRLLCDYIQERETAITIGNHTGPPIPLLSGVPQGGCLSPTLYILFTSDMPPPAPYSEYIMYADDITQVVNYPGKSTGIMARHTAAAINSINTFEKQWKIKTNIQKFKTIPIAKHKPAPLTIDNNIYPYNNEGMLLGLKITTTGYRKHVSDKVKRLRANEVKLKRFKKLSEKNKLHLYTALQRSILEYPAIPTCSLKKSNIRKLQVIQNKALRFCYDVRHTDRITNAALHDKAKLPTINCLLHERAKSVWNNIKDNCSEIYVNKIRDEEVPRSHSWFPTSANIINSDAPVPQY